MNEDRLNHLLSRYFDGMLAAEEKAEVEDTLLQSEKARAAFWEVATLHGLTREAAHWKWGETTEGALSHASQTPEPGLSLVSTSRGESSVWRWDIRWTIAVFGTAALFLIWLTVNSVLRPESAILARAVNVKWAEGTLAPLEGTALRPGPLHLTQGAVRIDFRSGARLVVEAPAQLDIIGRNAASCRFGRLSAEVPSTARGFTVQLRDVEVVDLGTEFGLQVPPSAEPEVHVFEGEVQLARTKNLGDTLHLTTGEAVHITAGAMDRIPADPTAFLRAEDLENRNSPEVRARHLAWKEASDVLNSDPASVLHFTFHDETPWDSTLTNRILTAERSTDGTIVGCNWTEGRWPGKKALDFTKPTDRVRLQLPQTMTTMSCLIWVRIDGLTNTFTHSLMTGDSEEPGTLRWTLSHQGNMRLGIARKSNGPEAAWAVGVSPSVVKEEDLGHWFMLATTFDGTNATHFLNGEKVWSGRMAAPESLSFGWVEIGNWAATPDNPEFAWAKGRNTHFFSRNFQGRIDEVAVVSRPLSAEEIQSYYAAGQPVEPLNTQESPLASR